MLMQLSNLTQILNRLCILQQQCDFNNAPKILALNCPTFNRRRFIHIHDVMIATVKMYTRPDIILNDSNQ